MTVTAVFAGRNVAAKGGRSAGLDRCHHLELAKADMTGFGITPCSTMVAEDVRDLQR